MKPLILGVVGTTMSLTAIACGGKKIVDVRVTDQAIQMSHTLAGGQTEFRITNAGTRDHSMKIAGSGIEIESVDVPPGETRSLMLDVPDSGGFNVFCAVGDHTAREKGVVVKIMNET